MKIKILSNDILTEIMRYISHLFVSSHIGINDARYATKTKKIPVFDDK